MNDPTEQIRRKRIGEINTEPGDRESLEARYGKVWDTQEMGADFEVIGFLAPIIVVRCRSDGCKGSLTFQHHPRFYFDFVLDS